MVLAQSYDSLQKLENIDQIVYFSEDVKDRAIKISNIVFQAKDYFEKAFNANPNYILMVLSPSDWKKYAHPNAIYGIPHSLPDGRLVVASENNNFWKRNTPPIDKLPEDLAQQLKITYADKNGEINLMDFFDLLAVHELGHTFQNAAGMNKQRSWLNELVCNVLLHTFIAEKKPKFLSSLTVYPQVTIAAFPHDKLKYTTLEDFEAYYNDIAQNHPDNYGWYQCRFHSVARQIYDLGGVDAMKNLWSVLLNQKETLDDEKLTIVVKKSHPALENAIVTWGK